MMYRSSTIHTTSPKTGVLLINLGSPTKPTALSIAAYLWEFLSDTRVVELPPILWRTLLALVILPLRSRRNIPKYRSVWVSKNLAGQCQPMGSPLHAYSQALTQKICTKINAQSETTIPVLLAMRYGNPSIQNALELLAADHCDRIVVVPLYPQYAASTTATAGDAINRALLSWRVPPTLVWFGQKTNGLDHLSAYPTADFYIHALVKSMKKAVDKLDNESKPDKWVLSFHGLPQSMVKAGDPYQRHCIATAEALRKSMGLSADDMILAYQSRFGANKWLTPSTESVLVNLAQSGVKKVVVVCPGFIADCLETLEEINMELREVFLHSGGVSYTYIPCLNDDETFADGLTQAIAKHLHA